MSSSSDDARPWEALPRWARRAITCWLVFHLFAIFIAPASVAPASDLARAGWNLCRPYVQALYLNHGYHYFAPDPGESTLLAFAVETAEGRVVEDVIPHRSIQPRLLYHRHFMLTESLGFVAARSEREASRPDEAMPTQDSLSPNAAPTTMPGPEPPLPEGLLRDWYTSYARCILNKYDGERVRLTRVLHYLPPIEMMQHSIAVGQPLTLSEPESFAEFPVGTFDWSGVVSSSDLETDPGLPQSQPAPGEKSDLVQLPMISGGSP